MFTFIRNLLGVKTDRAVQNSIEALVRWDPQSATEAELRTMEQYLDGLGQQVAEARAAYTKEKDESDAILSLSHQRMAAAEQLQQQLAAETDPARKAELEKSLETLVSMLEQMAPDIDREAKDASDAKDFLEMLEKSYAEAGGKLKDARAQLTRAQRDLGRADQQRQMADRQAEGARQAAGLSSATSSLSVALNAMQEAAAKERAQAEAANAKAKLLRPSQPEQEDPNIRAALAQASGAGRPPQSVGERLAALKSRQA